MLNFFAFHGGHGGHGSLWPFLRMLHDKMPGYFPEWFRWTLVVIFLGSIFFLLHAAIAKIKSLQNRSIESSQRDDRK